MMIQLTDQYGNLLNDADESREPEPSSVLLTQGKHGTAWQRFFDDGNWHCAGRRASKTWAGMVTERNLWLVYDAPVRPEPQR